MGKIGRSKPRVWTEKKLPYEALSVLVLVMIAGLPHQTFAQLINLSTRGFVGTADNVMIVGFIIGGSSSRTVVIRGRGPSLSGAPF